MSILNTRFKRCAHVIADNFAEFALARYLNGGSSGFALTSAVSRKTHGSAGSFDVPLPLTGTPGVECRSSRFMHTLVLQFNSDVVSGSASMTAGTGSVSGTPVFAGNTMTVNLTGVTDVQKLTLSLHGVTSSSSEVLPDTALSVNMLIGDATADKVVNTADVRLTRAQVGMPVGTANFREDINRDGTINGADVGIVRTASGHSVP